LLTRNDRELVAVPAGVVTVIGPVLAPLGTVALIDVSEATENVVAVTPLNVTLLAPVRCVPVIDTLVPTGPLVGVNDEIVGAAGGGVVVTVKAVVLVPVPPPVVTLMGPVVAPLGTVALIEVSDATENVAADTPLKVTLLAPVKPVPTIDTVVPTAPLVGVNDEMVGVGGGEVELGVTANSHVRQDVVDVVPPARLYWFPSQIRPTLPLLAGSGLAPE
jgi:hypothetical protein